MSTSDHSVTSAVADRVADDLLRREDTLDAGSNAVVDLVRAGRLDEAEAAAQWNAALTH
jgi:hypothetical protein